MIDPIGALRSLLSRLTAARAAQLDKLAGVEVVGTYSFVDNLNWQQVWELTPVTTRKRMHSIWMDLTLLVGALQTVQYRLSYKIGGGAYVIFQTNAASLWHLADEDGVLIAVECTISSPIKLEIIKTVAEGADRNIPYEVQYEDKE